MVTKKDKIKKKAKEAQKPESPSKVVQKTK